MSRSNPNENSTPNPSKRWFVWNGEVGEVRYYDKDTKANVSVGSDFQFMLLDQLGSVRGWHDPSQSGIYSNEVKDTRQDVMIVKAFKGGTLAEGVYRDIKLTVNALGGQFTTNCYIAFKLDGVLAIGSLRFKGAALSAWMEFCKAHRAELYSKAIRIQGFTEGKKGRIVYRMPVLKSVEVSEVSNAAATALDVTLQEFLAKYLARNTQDQTEGHLRDEDVLPPAAPSPIDEDELPPLEEYDSDIPFMWLAPLILPAMGVIGLWC